MPTKQIAPTVLAGGDVRLYHGDCIQVMRALPDGCVDAVVTDCPYNVGKEYASYEDQRDDYREWCAEWFAELKRVCSGAIAITTGIVNIKTWLDIEEPTWWMAWMKTFSTRRTPCGFNNWVPIAFYGKVVNRTRDIIVAPIKPNRNVDGHPCPNPLEWAVQQVNMLCPDGGTVFDPFTGTGTTAIAALKTGRKFVGSELNATYVGMCRKRIDRFLKKPKRPVVRQETGGARELLEG